MTCLARLLTKRGRCDAGLAMLAEIYSWFTDGFLLLRPRTRALTDCPHRMGAIDARQANAQASNPRRSGRVSSCQDQPRIAAYRWPRFDQKAQAFAGEAVLQPPLEAIVQLLSIAGPI